MARARQTQCANNVRQLGTALQGFVAENHTYPLCINPDYLTGGYPEHRSSWIAVLQHTELSQSTNHMNASEYLSKGVWLCPSARKRSRLPQDKLILSYGYNSYGMSAKAATNAMGLGGHYVWVAPRLPAPPVNESEVTIPSEMMAIGDGFTGGDGVIRDFGFDLRRTYGIEDYLGSTERARSRHRSKANVVFCDGHVEPPALKFLFDDTSDDALSRWNRDHQPHRERLAP